MSHLVIIEATGFLHRAYHVVPDMRRYVDGAPIGAINAFCSMMWRIVHKFSHATHMVVVGDRGGRPTFRHRLDHRYKANRPPPKIELKTQLDMVEGVIAAFGLPYVAIAGVEADDIIATYATQWMEAAAMAAAMPYGKVECIASDLVTIITNDKDMMQLVTDRIIIFDPVKEVFVDPNAVSAKFGVSPLQVSDWLALVGDSADNVRGVQGIGPKTATKMLQDFQDLEGIYDNLDKLVERHRNRLIEGKIPLLLAHALVSLNRDIKGLPEAFQFRFQRNRDWSALGRYCRDNNLEDLANRIEVQWYE
jgi:DNA polymerase-1